MGFQTVKLILPESAAGWAVGVFVGLGVLVGLGVGLGPLRVAVGEGVRVGVGVLVALVGVAVGVDVVLAIRVDVLRTMGVQVGVAVAPAATWAVEEGMVSTWPARIKAGLVMPLADASSFTLTSNRAAISDRVSPGWTV
jgi:hypothetical protein